MVHGWMMRVSKQLSRKRKKGEASTSLSMAYGMGSGLHAETRCRKVYAGEVFQ